MGQTIKCMNKVPSDHLLHHIKLMPWLHNPILRIHTSKLLSLPHGERFKPANRQLRKWEKSAENLHHTQTCPQQIGSRFYWELAPHPNLSSTDRESVLTVLRSTPYFCFSDMLHTHRHTTNIKLAWVLPLQSTMDQWNWSIHQKEATKGGWPFKSNESTVKAECKQPARPETLAPKPTKHCL